VPAQRRVFTDGCAPTLWLLGRSADDPGDRNEVEMVRVPCDGNGFAPRRLLDVLAERGLGRVLVEGGGVTVSRFLRDGALQRLYLTVAPLIVGDGVPGLHFPGSPRMREALRAPVRRVAMGEDMLFELDLEAGRSQPSGAACQ
jgi:riboflavin biosynthesis pyrimidine reductase